MRPLDQIATHIFIGGPITHLSKHPLASAWVEKFLVTAAKTFEEAGWLVHSAHIAECFGLDVPTADIIVKRDINWLSKSSYAVFLLPSDVEQSPLRTDGTFIEIGYAIRAKIPCSILVETLDEHSPMLNGLADLSQRVSLFTIDTSQDEVLQTIKTVQAVVEATLQYGGIVG